MNPVRYDFCLNVPSVSEQGFGEDYMVWFGLFAPKRGPKEVRNRIEEAWLKSVEQPEVKKVTGNTGVIPPEIFPLRVLKLPCSSWSEFKVFASVLFPHAGLLRTLFYA